jgi:hypothetical protein
MFFMSAIDEQLRFQQFKKMSHSLARTRTTPFEIQLKDISSDLKYYTPKIKEACKNQEDAELKKLIEKVIKLFAKRTIVQIAEQEELFGSISDDIIEDEIKKYSIQCARFLDTVDVLTESYA